MRLIEERRSLWGLLLERPLIKEYTWGGEKHYEATIITQRKKESIEKRKGQHKKSTIVDACKQNATMSMQFSFPNSLVTIPLGRTKMKHWSSSRLSKTYSYNVSELITSAARFKLYQHHHSWFKLHQHHHSWFKLHQHHHSWFKLHQHHHSWDSDVSAVEAAAMSVVQETKSKHPIKSVLQWSSTTVRVACT